MSLEEGMTTGVKKALARMTGDKQRSICPKCGFVLPKYPGRYPSACPSCGEARTKAINRQTMEQGRDGA